MGSLVELGGVPEWAQAAVEAGALYLAVRGRWQEQAVDWAKELERLSAMTTEELRRAVEASPALAELVGLAWEEAARTASEDKRRLLAKVIAAALRGDSDVLVDATEFLLPTVIALDPAHVALLVVIATPQVMQEARPGGTAGMTVDRKQMTSRWRASEDLLDPALAALEREGLVDGKRGLGGGVGTWTLRPYGARFFHFLKEVGETDSPNSPKRTCADSPDLQLGLRPNAS